MAIRLDMRRLYVCLLIGMCVENVTEAGLKQPGFSLSGGLGKPSGLRGARASVIWDTGFSWLQDRPVRIDTYWDMSIAGWLTDGQADTGLYKNVAVLGFAPFFQFVGNQGWSFEPYFEASVGVSLMTSSRVGSRNLGSIANFQDFLGVGVHLGERKQHSLSLHYLHYSNAGIWPPNDGVDVIGLLRWTYRLDEGSLF
jgi:lipid A 3-O-deacylase